MARWNLRRAAQLVEQGGGDAAEAAQWRRSPRHWSTGGIRRAACTSSSPATGISSRCSSPTSPSRPSPPTCCSGAERVAGSQLIKQADVLMLHHLVPDEVDARTRWPPTSRSTSRAPPTAARCRPRSTPRSSPGPASRSGRSSCSGSPPGSTSTTSRAPPPAACTWPRWAASGRRSPTGSSGCVPRRAPRHRSVPARRLAGALASLPLPGRPDRRPRRPRHRSPSAAHARSGPRSPAARSRCCDRPAAPSPSKGRRT